MKDDKELTLEYYTLAKDCAKRLGISQQKAEFWLSKSMAIGFNRGLLQNEQKEPVTA